MMQYLFVFIAMAVADFLWTQYIVATTKGQATSAAIWSGSIILVNGAAVCVYVGNPWTIIAAAFGAVVGTFASVKLVERKELKVRKEGQVDGDI